MAVAFTRYRFMLVVISHKIEDLTKVYRKWRYLVCKINQKLTTFVRSKSIKTDFNGGTRGWAFTFEVMGDKCTGFKLP